MIRFVIHGGYGKTATTFLQEKIFSHLNDVLYLGKLQNDKFISDELYKAYYDLFPPLYNKELVRARNSSILLPHLGDLLLKEIGQAKKSIVLLSNESLFDFGNYNAELNMLLLVRLFQYLQDNCDKRIEFKIMMTIRNQKDLLKSFYAYDFTHLKEQFNSFNRFIQYGIDNKHEILFGGCYYDLILKDMKQIYGSDNVQFFIYEKMNEEITLYLLDILDFIGTKHKLDELSYGKNINVNSNGGVHKIREVKHGVIARLILKIYQRNKGIIKKFETINILIKLKNMLKAY